MKKIIALIIVGAMSMALFGCGKKDDNKGGGAASTSASKAVTVDDIATVEERGVEFARKGDQTVFKVDSSVELMQDAWLGFCPGTKGFTKEVDADEVDVLYAYIANGDKRDSEDYLFEFDNDQFEGLEDGDYVMVLCDSDDENVGKVLLYIPAKISGDKVTLEYDKVVFNK